MTTNATATAMSAAPIVSMPTGIISKSTDFTYTGAVITASANALTVQMAKVPHGATIVGLNYQGSSGAATCPVDIGIEVTSGATSMSRFASAVTIGSAYVVTPLGGGIPFTVSCPDSQVTRYAKVYCGATPGTATSAIQMALTVFYTFQGNA
mgnify:CR=1 FL=1|tara:strand:+ start:21263 stop:21718 length:456 start_codon:yes stop_codon:yes gene_type:complete